MSATNRALALAWEEFSLQPEAFASAAASVAPAALPAPVRPALHVQPLAPSIVPPAAPRVPQLRVMPLLRKPYPRQFVRVPTHAVGVHAEKREYPRASLKLPLKLRSVSGTLEQFPVTLVTRDISSSGVFFLCPKPLELGTPIELEIVLISRPLGRGNVVMVSKARVCRTENANMPGWHGIAASFDDLDFGRDDRVPHLQQVD